MSRKTGSPQIECTSTRVSKLSKPSAYRQCTATGTVAMNAIRPDHRCRPPIQDGALIHRTFPYITSDEPTCTTANSTATEASQAFTVPGLENPTTSTATPVGECSRP